MNERTNNTTRNGSIDPVRLQRVMQDAVRDALRRHMLLGESVAVAGENGETVRILTPDEIRAVLERSESQ